MIDMLFWLDTNSLGILAGILVALFILNQTRLQKRP